MTASVIIAVCLCVIFCGTEAAVVIDDRSATLVYPRLLESRSADGQHVLTITDDLTLTLTRSTVFAERFVLRNFLEDATAQEHHLKASDFEKHLYHDARHMASVTVKDRGGIQVEGVLGLNRRIRPAPELERSESGEIAHLVYEVEEVSPYSNSTVGVHPDLRVEERQYGQSLRDPADLPETIYPEICIVSDSMHASGYKKGMTSAVEYMGVYINAVNMRYLSVNQPNVSLRIVAIILSSPEQEAYIDHVQGSPKYVMGISTLYNFALVVHNDSWYSRCDMVYLMTGLDMALSSGTFFDPSLRGLAYVGQSCTFYRVGMGEDAARKFSGIHVMAHEIAHILGCPHDGDHPPANMRGSPGSAACPWNDGYIMSYLVKNLNHFRFSSCCNDMITFSARSAAQKCLLEVNVQWTKVIWRNKLPGELNITLDKQCKWKFPGVPETKLTDNLQQVKKCMVRCSLPPRVAGRESDRIISVLDGTPCRGHKGLCYNGVCRRTRPKFEPRSSAEGRNALTFRKSQIN